jgi:hypothetical protein
MSAAMRPACALALVAFAGFVFAGSASAGPHGPSGGPALKPPRHHPVPHNPPAQPPGMKPPLAVPPVAMPRPAPPLRPMPPPRIPGPFATPGGPRGGPAFVPFRPFGPGFYPYPVIVETAQTAAPVAGPRPAVRPVSVNVLDPFAVVTRAPSGRVVIAGGAGWGPPGDEAARPYAPPAFHLIGAPSGRHMGRPVHVVHGVPSASDRPTEPKVIWLKEPRAARGAVKSGG